MSLGSGRERGVEGRYSRRTDGVYKFCLPDLCSLCFRHCTSRSTLRRAPTNFRGAVVPLKIYNSTPVVISIKWVIIPHAFNVTTAYNISSWCVVKPQRLFSVGFECIENRLILASVFFPKAGLILMGGMERRVSSFCAAVVTPSAFHAADSGEIPEQGAIWLPENPTGKELATPCGFGSLCSKIHNTDCPKS